MVCLSVHLIGPRYTVAVLGTGNRQLTALRCGFGCSAFTFEAPRTTSKLGKEMVPLLLDFVKRGADNQLISMCMCMCMCLCDV